jgi:hypothetical protein
VPQRVVAVEPDDHAGSVRPSASRGISSQPQRVERRYLAETPSTRANSDCGREQRLVRLELVHA